MRKTMSPKTALNHWRTMNVRALCMFVLVLVLRSIVAQWTRHRPTELGIAGSSPAEVICPRSRPSRKTRELPIAKPEIICFEQFDPAAGTRTWVARGQTGHPDPLGGFPPSDPGSSPRGGMPLLDANRCCDSQFAIAVTGLRAGSTATSQPRFQFSPDC